MCGIIGILRNSASDSTIGELVAGLKKLEYRGYDSWGYAFIGNGGIRIEKKAGRISVPTLKGSTAAAIGHSRWATHGAVTDENAHPHADCGSTIAVVHNGIIENYLELRETLAKAGHAFRSQTDSEVVAHLLESAQGTLFERAKAVAPMLRGSFAIVAIDAGAPGEMVAMKNESPLAIGIAQDCVVFASDPLAFLDRTDKAIYLGEGEIAHAKADSGSIKLGFYDYNTKTMMWKKPQALEWKAEAAELNGHEHYMIKEIFEQPRMMVRGADVASAQKLSGMMKGRKVIAIACGTARHAAVIGKHVLHRVARYPLDVMMAHEFSYFLDSAERDTVMLAVSQSGETADVLECVRKAKKRGMKVISIVNVPSSTLARESDAAYYINCGPEIAVASTKAFTNQVLAFYMIAYALRGEAAAALEKVNRLAAQMETRLPYFDKKAREIAGYLKTKSHVYMIGRGVNFPLALEGSLKLKEISYVHAEGMPAGELKHGTLALIESGTPVLLLNPSDYTYNDSIGNGLETKARGAYLIGISDRNHPAFSSWVELPKPEEEVFYPFFEILPLQLIAYHTARLLGKDIDKPRNLAKSVTVK